MLSTTGGTIIAGGRVHTCWGKQCVHARGRHSLTMRPTSSRRSLSWGPSRWMRRSALLEKLFTSGGGKLSSDTPSSARARVAEQTRRPLLRGAGHLSTSAPSLVRDLQLCPRAQDACDKPAHGEGGDAAPAAQRMVISEQEGPLEPETLSLSAGSAAWPEQKQCYASNESRRHSRHA